ncbi:MAG: CHASE2 domain-containing protein, partial [Desulforhopalus sp.]
MNFSYRILSPLFTIIFCLLLAQTHFFTWLGDASLDFLFAIRGPKATSQSIVIVGIDEQSLKELGPWPFPRSAHARLLENLGDARSIGFDLIFHNDDVYDTVFLEAIKRSPPVSLAIAKNYSGELLFPAKILVEHVSKGHIETLLGKDGLVRRVELRKWDLPVISAAMLTPERVNVFSKNIDDSPQIINFYGPEFTFLYVSYLDVINDKIDPAFFKDRFVMVGSQALALGDVHITPFSSKHPVPGVEVQATILNNLLEESFIINYQTGSYLLAVLSLALGFFVWPKGRELRNILYGISTIIVVMAISITFFQLNFFINPSLPIFILLLAYFIHLISQWLWLTAKLVKEIQRLDQKLDEGIEKVFTTIPAGLQRSSKLEHPGSGGGISKQLENIHSGIETLAVQNRFINHLLSEETPPLALWQKQNGELVLANSGFTKLWLYITKNTTDTPLLSDFYQILDKLAVEGQHKALRKIIGN